MKHGLEPITINQLEGFLSAIKDGRILVQDCHTVLSSDEGVVFFVRGQIFRQPTGFVKLKKEQR